MKWQTYELYLRNLMAQKLDIPVLGKLHFACLAGSSTSLFEEWMRTEMDIPADLIFMGATAPALAFEAASANRNDAVLIFPGAYQIASELAWNKDRVHAVGMGGPTSFNDYSEANVSIYTTEAGVAETVDLTGDHCQFQGINFANNGANTGNLAAFNVDGYNAQFSGCSFHGAMNTTNCVAAAAALYIDGLGSWYQFKNCVIGDDNWFIRDSANSGQLAYVQTVSALCSQHGKFEDCRFRLASETDTVAMVRQADQYGVDRIHEFIRCSFTNHSVNYGATLNQVFYNPPGMITNSILLRDCIASGFTEWQTTDHGLMYQGNQPTAVKNGGLAVELVT